MRPFSLPTIEHNGVERVLACLPAYGMSGLPAFRDAYAAIDLAKVEDLLLDPGLPIEDQGQSSACGGFSTHYAIENSHAIRAGGEIVSLSPGYLYSKCNRGQDQGSVISDLLEAAKKFGCAPARDFPFPAIFVGQGGPDADRNAQRFRVEEAYELASFEEAIAALAKGMVVVQGLQLAANFTRTDREGISPPAAGKILGGHALCANEIYRSRRYGLCIGGPNSWGVDFGLDGRYRVPRQGYYDGRYRLNAFAVKGLIPDPSVDGPVAK